MGGRLIDLLVVRWWRYFCFVITIIMALIAGMLIERGWLLSASLLALWVLAYSYWHWMYMRRKGE